MGQMSRSKPTFQIVVDLHGEAVQEQHLYYLQNLVMAIMGAERIGGFFWITRCDLFHDYCARYKGMRDILKDIGDAKFHEPSFDLYLREHDPYQPVPIGRLVNVKIPELPE